MTIKLKQLSEQVLVITGASSGIGRATAKMAAAQGARVVLAARSDEALLELQNLINETGGEAISVMADVGKQDDVCRIADTAN